MKLKAKKSLDLKGNIEIPGDKSISHRALMCSAISNGKCEILNLQRSEDVLNTLSVLKELNVEIESKEDRLIVSGRGFSGLQEPNKELFFGNSGTGIRLMTGILPKQEFSSTLTGDDSLSSRPMMRVIEPLKKMGISIDCSSNQTPPLKIFPSRNIKGINYDMPIASAQVKSAILFASLGLDEETIINEEKITRNHTELMFDYFGANIEFSSKKIILSPTDKLLAKKLFIPGDFSSAAFFIVSCLITNNSKILLQNVGINPTRIGLLNKLKEMGAKINILDERNLGNEMVSDLEVETSELSSCDVNPDEVPNLIDELPVLFIASCFAKGTSSFKSLKELKHKESDRLSIMINLLKKMGVNAELTEDNLLIEGKGKDFMFDGFDADSYGDHRIAMALVIAGLNCNSQINISNYESINTSFPEFFSLGKSIGFNIEIS